jgi:hypothetical protein
MKRPFNSQLNVDKEIILAIKISKIIYGGDSRPLVVWFRGQRR